MKARVVVMVMNVIRRILREETLTRFVWSTPGEVETKAVKEGEGFTIFFDHA